MGGVIGGKRATRGTSAQVQIRDPFRPLPSYCVDPLTITAVGLMLGEAKMDKARKWAKDRAIGEFAVIGDAGIRIELHPAKDSWPPEPWLHEFVKPKYMHKAHQIISDENAWK